MGAASRCKYRIPSRAPSSRSDLGGEARASILVPDGCAEAAHLLEVTEGTLTMSATSLANDVVVEAGMCLVKAESEEGADSPHLFESLAAGACQ